MVEQMFPPLPAADAWSRRRLLVRAGQFAAIGALGPTLLAACAGSDPKSGSGAKNLASSGGGKPVRGGTFTVGMVGVGEFETVNPATVGAISDIARTYALFDRFFDVGPDIKTLVPGLALTATPNDDATVWTLDLRDGVVWHDGKPFTADDAVYSLQAFGAPDNYGSGLVVDVIDFKNIRKVGPLTIEVPLLHPDALFPALLTGYNAGVIQAGATAEQLSSKPIGTGPFSFDSFTAGRRSVFQANKNYWQEGKPYVDTLVIDSSFSDVVAQVNALRSGQINVLPQLPYAQAASVKTANGVKVIQSPGVAAQYLKMRVDKGPLVDQRVRRALQLLTDRQGMIDGALNGFGTVANDLMAPGTEYFASDLKKERDVDEAKSLLKAAGAENLAITLTTSNAFAGSLESATLFAQQAKAGGVSVKVDNLSTAAIAEQYFDAPFGNAYSVALPSLEAAYRSLMASNAVFPETGWGTPERDAAVAAAVAATDTTKAASLWSDVQNDWADGGPYIVWGFADNLDAVSSQVRGLAVSKAGNLNNFRFQDGWLVA